MIHSINIDINQVKIETLASGVRAIMFDISNELNQREISLYMQSLEPVKIKWEGNHSNLNVSLEFGKNVINIKKLPIKILDYLEMGDIGFMPLFSDGFNMGLIKWPEN